VAAIGQDVPSGVAKQAPRVQQAHLLNKCGVQECPRARAPSWATSELPSSCFVDPTQAAVPERYPTPPGEDHKNSLRPIKAPRPLGTRRRGPSRGRRLGGLRELLAGQQLLGSNRPLEGALRGCADRSAMDEAGRGHLVAHRPAAVAAAAAAAAAMAAAEAKAALLCCVGAAPCSRGPSRSAHARDH
jgi:hypothetical protein